MQAYNTGSATGELVLASLSDVVREVFEISDFGESFPVFDSTDTALEQGERRQRGQGV